MTPETREKITNTLQQNPVVLYMKGTRSMPQCGFSGRVVEILNGLLTDFAKDAGHDPETVAAARLALGASSWEREIP